MLILSDAIINILPRLLQDQRNATCYVNDKPRCVIIDYEKSIAHFYLCLSRQKRIFKIKTFLWFSISFMKLV